MQNLWLWLLIAIMKRCAERCALQFYRTSLSLRVARKLKTNFSKEMKETYLTNLFPMHPFSTSLKTSENRKIF